MKAIPESKWPWLIETKRLDMKIRWHNKEYCLYEIIRKTTGDKVGETSYFHDGQIVCEIYEAYRGADYEVEVIKTLVKNVPTAPTPYLRVRKTDDASKCIAERSGFRKTQNSDSEKFDLWFYSL